MGVAIGALLVKKEIELSSLSGKVLTVDAPMWLYQFLSSIRQPDGTPLMDSKNNITSHLMGLSTRVPNLMEKGIKLAFCFDGKVPDLKQKERDRRNGLKLEAEALYEEAAKKQDIAGMKKYAQRSNRLTSNMITEAKELLEAFGIPVINSPSEGEAQASHIVKKGEAYAVASNDADVLMFGAPKLIKNLNIVGKKKKASQIAYEVVKPELVELSENLKYLGIDNDKLIAMSMLVGTDYNIGGIKGIGPKGALSLVKKHDAVDAIFKEARWSEHFTTPWQDIFNLIKTMPITDDYELKWKPIDKEKIMRILVDNHDFAEERVQSALEKLGSEKEQKGLADFFK